MQRRLLDDCFRPDDPQKPFLHSEAIAFLKECIAPAAGSSSLSIAKACDRILAQDVRASHAVPLHANSAVDGYAFAHSDYGTADTHITLQVAGVSAAGHAFEQQHQKGQAVRILTGAVIPDGCDSVAMQEDCEVDAASGTVEIPQGLKRGANIRPAGEDVSEGDLLFAAGHVVRPQDLAALASIGLGEVDCYLAPTVTLFATGDELVPPGQGPLARGQVFDANTAMLSALITKRGCDLIQGGVLPDDFSRVRDALENAAAHSSSDAGRVIITSGGASRGSEDHIANALAALGTRHYWQINIKPGRPIMFGQIGDSVVIGLPGNPVAAFVCFLLYVHPLLGRLGGTPWREPLRLNLPAGFEFQGRKRGRREYWRAWTDITAEGRLIAHKFPRDGSGLISGLRAASGLIEVPEETGDVHIGDTVTFIPFTEFGITPGTSSF